MAQGETVLNPQQQEFLKNFLDPKSETFSNYLQSALKAGYSEEYAKNISGQMPKWLDESLEDSNLVREALNNLSEFIRDKENKSIQWDATKFTLSRLNKGKFSEKMEQEHSNPDGNLKTIVINKYGGTNQPTS